MFILQRAEQVGIGRKYDIYLIDLGIELGDLSGTGIGYGQCHYQIKPYPRLGNPAHQISPNQDNPPGGHYPKQGTPHVAVQEESRAFAQPRQIPIVLGLALFHFSQGIEMLEAFGMGCQFAHGSLSAQDGILMVEGRLKPRCQPLAPTEGYGAVHRLEERAVAEEVEVEGEGMFGIGLVRRAVEVAEVVVDALQFALAELLLGLGIAPFPEEAVMHVHQRGKGDNEDEGNARQDGPALFAKKVNSYGCADNQQ